MKLELTRRDIETLDFSDLRMMQIFIRLLRLKYRCRWMEYGRSVDGSIVRIVQLEIGDKRDQEAAE